MPPSRGSPRASTTPTCCGNPTRYVLPFLAEQEDSEAVDLVFQAFNRYLGVAVGEHLGYLLTGAWTTLAGIALLTASMPLGVLGIVIGPALMVCSLEFVGRSTGWTVAGNSPRPPTSPGRCG